MIIHQELKYHDKQLLGFPKKKKKPTVWAIILI